MYFHFRRCSHPLSSSFRSLPPFLWTFHARAALGASASLSVLCPHQLPKICSPSGRGARAACLLHGPPGVLARFPASLLCGCSADCMPLACPSRSNHLSRDRHECKQKRKEDRHTKEKRVRKSVSAPHAQDHLRTGRGAGELTLPLRPQSGEATAFIARREKGNNKHTQ